jgi:hypothetical protein
MQIKGPGKRCRTDSLPKHNWCLGEDHQNPDKPGEFVLEPTLGMTFDLHDELYNFYNLYSWEHGFGVRYGKSRLKPQRTDTMQEMDCA